MFIAFHRELRLPRERRCLSIWLTGSAVDGHCFPWILLHCKRCFISQGGPLKRIFLHSKRIQRPNGIGPKNFGYHSLILGWWLRRLNYVVRPPENGQAVDP